jgi:hypothetical protein
MYLSIFLSIACLVWGYLDQELTTQTAALVILGISWMFGQTRWVWVGSLGLAGVTIAVIIGILFNVQEYLMFSGLLFGFLAWDLAEFKVRLKQAAKEDDIPGFEKHHFIRLGLVWAAGIGVLLLTRVIRLGFSFEVAALLVLAGVWGISKLVGRLLRNE